MNKTAKKGWLALAALALAALLLAGVYYAFMPRGAAGAKTITVAVVLADGTQNDHTLHTDAENLRGALEEAGLVEGEEGPYGLYITTVDGVTADWDANGSWWCLTKGGEMLETGADDTPIADGDAFELTYTVG